MPPGYLVQARLARAGLGQELVPYGRLTPLSRRARLAFVALLACLVYLNAIPNPYLWDDRPQIEANEQLYDWRNLRKLFTRDYYSLAAEVSYRPVRVVSLMITLPVLGPGPAGHRLVNVLVHAGNSGLVYLVGESLFSPPVAFVAALLFAVHPVHSETVNCVSYRADQLAALFFLAAFLAFRRRKTAWAASWFVLAALSKESAVTLPVVALADALLGDKERRRQARTPLLALAAVAAVYLFARLALLSSPSQRFEYPGGSLLTNALTMAGASLTYLRLLALPVRLAVSYDVPVLVSPADPRFLLSLAVLAAIAAAAFSLCRRDARWTLPALWVPVTLLPMLNLIPFLDKSLIFERYLYLPAVGFCLLAALALLRLPRPALVPSVAALVLLLAAATVRRNRDWASAERLYESNVAVFPRAANMAAFLGKAYLDSGKTDAAVSQFEKSIRLDPRHDGGYSGLGAAFHRQGRYDAAIESFRKALELEPYSPDTRLSLATAYFDGGRFQEALEVLEESLRRNPADPQSLRLLILFLAGSGRPDRAIEAARGAPAEARDSPGVQAGLGVAYAKKGMPQEAIAAFRSALALYPYDAETRRNLGAVYAGAGLLEAGARELSEAVRLAPRSDKARRDLALTYLKLGRTALGLSELEAYLALSPDGPERAQMAALRERLARQRAR